MLPPGRARGNTETRLRALQLQSKHPLERGADSLGHLNGKVKTDAPFAGFPSPDRDRGSTEAFCNIGAAHVMRLAPGSHFGKGFAHSELIAYWKNRVNYFLP